MKCTFVVTAPGFSIWLREECDEFDYWMSRFRAEPGYTIWEEWS